MRPTRSLLASVTAVALLTGAGPLPIANGTPLRTLTGTVRLLAVDAPDGSRGSRAGKPAESRNETSTWQGLRTRAVADVGGRLLDLPTGPAASLRPGDRVTVTTTQDAQVAASVVRTEAASTEPAPPRAKKDVTGPHTLTVLPVYWDHPDPDTPLTTLTALAASTAEYWSGQSGGRIAVTPTVRGWGRIDDPGSCSSSALANAALTAHGVDLPTDPRNHVLIYFPHRDDCGGWAGLGEVTGPLIWDNGYPLVDVVAHEFGHNLGLGHANTAACWSDQARVTLSSSCTVTEYRDYADIMGIAMGLPSGNLNTALADAIGLARTVTAEPRTRTSVDLAPLTRTDAVRAVKIRVPSGWLYVDYRPAQGRDVRMPRWAGVQIHLLPDGDIPTSQLLDGQPAAQFDTVSLPTDTPWTVPGTGLTVLVTSMTSTTAHLEVAPVGVLTPPTPVITAPATGTVVGAATTLSWRVPSPVTSVRVFVDNRLISTTATRTLSGTVRVTGLTSGPHNLTLQTAGTTWRASAKSTPIRLVTDLTPPSIPSGLSLSPRQVLSWRASQDLLSGTAGYLVSLDGSAPRTTRGTSFVTRTPPGRHTWWVASRDRVGNVSAANGLVVVRTAISRSRPPGGAPPRR